ncbi:hypothetical protein ABH930_000309 [Kitasatospora sp. GAS204A]|uniref:DUF6221 family protein n=1 Tax=unclassified Kitasatospora TaxID=2633591 RepID=UPI00247627CD|nr:DUF6221 family protein [Kitasatospora sp. GAS204B]MDH6116890.1 hypothetical protein [Kitasatospora sp. GAS204B]
MTGDLVAFLRERLTKARSGAGDMTLFRRRSQTDPLPLAKMRQFGPSKENLEEITDFIQLRLSLITPPMFPAPDDTGRAIRALGDVAVSARVVGNLQIDQGGAAILEWATLQCIADHWRDHPDYRKEWDSIR